MTVTATIKNWTIVKASGSLFLKGYAYGHENPDYAADGDQIVTSAILGGQDGYIHTVDGVYYVGG